MIRPKYEDYQGYLAYTKALEEYCEKIELAFDDACDFLEIYELANRELTRPIKKKEDWKVSLLHE